jgi:lysosomal alpha-mannosidase
VDYIRDIAPSFLTNHVFVTMGCDFNYMNADRNFKNIDKLIDYVNHGDYNMTLFYSTPNEYLDVMKNEAIDWPTKTDDFFPYADNPHSYWTGYFTSRPALKGYVRTSGSFFRAE